MIVPIYPPLDGESAERFHAFAMKLACAQRARNANEMSSALESEISWCRSAECFGENVLAYEACIRVLSDLARLRWRIVEQGYGFALENRKERVVRRPTEEIVARKEMLRSELQPIVDEQKRHPAVWTLLPGWKEKTVTVGVVCDCSWRMERSWQPDWRPPVALKAKNGWRLWVMPSSLIFRKRTEVWTRRPTSAPRNLALFPIQLVDTSSTHSGTAASLPCEGWRASGPSGHRDRGAQQLSSRNGREARKIYRLAPRSDS